MKTRRIVFELPAELAEYLGRPEQLAAKARKAFVLELLREASISQGKAAELLEMTRWDILDLMAEYSIPSALRTKADLVQELEAARRVAPEERG